jgi:hypothetical protein
MKIVEGTEEEMMVEEKSPYQGFREIGLDTAMWFQGGCRETIFFIALDRKTRLKSVHPEAVKEFVEYWKNQIALAEEYVANGCNPNTNEWKQPSVEAT